MRHRGGGEIRNTFSDKTTAACLQNEPRQSPCDSCDHTHVLDHTRLLGRTHGDDRCDLAGHVGEERGKAPRRNSRGAQTVGCPALRPGHDCSWRAEPTSPRRAAVCYVELFCTPCEARVHCAMQEQHSTAYGSCVGSEPPIEIAREVTHWAHEHVNCSGVIVTRVVAVAALTARANEKLVMNGALDVVFAS